MTFLDNIVSQIEDISNYAVRYEVRHSFRSICEFILYASYKFYIAFALLIWSCWFKV